MAVLLLISGLVTLIIAGELLVRGAVGIAYKAKLSTLVVGVTIVSIGTSAPELIVSIDAALSGHPDISIGNVVGSNIANIALVLGITACIYPIAVSKNTLRYDWPVLFISSAILVLFIQNNILNQTEGIIFILMLIAYMVFTIITSRKEQKAKTSDTPPKKQKPLYINIILVTIGSIGLIFGASWMVDGAVEISKNFGVPERVIAISAIAFGTSLPELATSIIAAIRKEMDISIGNLIGSNIFNILSILGITSVLHPIEINQQIKNIDIYWMLAIAIILLPFMLIKKRILRIEGAIFVIIYIVYVYLLF